MFGSSRPVIMDCAMCYDSTRRSEDGRVQGEVVYVVSLHDEEHPVDACLSKKGR